jgi:formate hydrogenlyase subunit 4
MQAAHATNVGGRRATRLFAVAVTLAFGPLALGLVANVLNEYDLVSVEGTWRLFSMAPIVSMFTMPAAIVVLIPAVKAMFPRKPERRDARASWYL